MFGVELPLRFLTIVVIFFTTLCIYFKWLYSYWDRKGVKCPAPVALLGNASDLVFQKETLGLEMRNVYQMFNSQGLRYCGYYFLWRPILIVLDPELVKTIMTKDFLYFTDHGMYVNEEIDPLSGHLFSLKGLKWKNLRAKLTPTFTSGKMKMMFDTLLHCSDELIVLMDNHASNNTIIDIKDVLARFSTDVIGSCAFGIECNSLKDPNADFRKYGSKVFELDIIEGLKNLASIVYPNLLSTFNIALTKKDVTKFFMDIVKQTVAYRELNNITRKDFMQMLIQLKNNQSIMDEDDELKSINSNKGAAKSQDGKTLTISELAAQAYVFFLAGFETSSTTLTFCFYELVNKLEVQEKLRQEINEVLKKYNGEVTYDALMDMTFMDKCINETLRKYPPVPVLTRECNKTYKVPDSNLVIEQGTQIFIPAYGIQHDFQHYPDPENFDPERFSPEIKSTRHAFTWLPFGEGPRACIGTRFGVMQTKVALTMLLKNYKFSLNPKTRTPLIFDPKSFVLTTQGSVWLNATKITA